MNPKVDQYFIEGCGRCPLGGTPSCKVLKWTAEMTALRRIVLECGLAEEVKWGVPCYTFEGHNVIILSAFVNSCTLSFFKGVLLQDPHEILEQPGENSQSGRVIRFTDLQKVQALESVIKEYVYEAIEVEKAGLKVDFKEKHALVYPEELIAILEEDPVLKSAFAALTPGRQRGYILYFTSAKQPQTRISRIEKCTPQILAGKGMHD